MILLCNVLFLPLSSWSYNINKKINKLYKKSTTFHHGDSSSLWQVKPTPGVPLGKSFSVRTHELPSIFFDIRYRRYPASRQASCLSTQEEIQVRIKKLNSFFGHRSNTLSSRILKTRLHILKNINSDRRHWGSFKYTIFLCITSLIIQI